jgi:hypothetical protein
MKNLFIFLLFIVLVLFSTSAMAVDLAWEHDNPSNVNGYTLYYEASDGSGDKYLYTVGDGMTLTATLPDSHFKPGLEFTIYATAYNLDGESDPSNVITYKRTGYGPPPNKEPIKLWLRPGKPKNLR